ncbi:MAG: hypothetical protein ABI843_09240 [Dokdonella sp.]
MGALLVAGVAAATDFPLSGTLSVNGNSGALPDGGTFAGSSYDGLTGVIGAGAFTFPQGTISTDSPLGPIVVTYVLSQTDTSTGMVAADGVAALTTASIRLLIVSVSTILGPLDIGTCELEPIDIDLSGPADASGLDLADAGFTIPEVASSDCGGYGDEINTAVAGNDTAIEVLMSGDFTPPAGNDTIFANGFELPAG